jgi:hypothetical protein
MMQFRNRISGFYTGSLCVFVREFGNLKYLKNAVNTCKSVMWGANQSLALVFHEEVCVVYF